MASAVLKKIASKQRVSIAETNKSAERAKAIFDNANPVQRLFLSDTSIFQSILCPRRAGKSFSITSKALYIGECKPGARILIISLNLKSTKENFWGAAPGGIFWQNKVYGLNLHFNNTDYTWTHENGSRGRLAGADTRADIEAFRGAGAENDAVFIDEAGSFAPDLLRDLVFEVLMPGLMTRGGTICLTGTPGLIPQGLFYEATSVVSVVSDEDNPEIQRNTCKLFDGTALPEESPQWSLHRWTIEDNIAAPEQWKRAKRAKKARNLTDESPTWRREYLGEWVTDPSELVYYGYLENRDSGRVTWNPEYSLDNPTGLPSELGPWHRIMGLDFGFEDDSAIVYAAWSEVAKQMLVFYTFKSKHLNIDEFGEEILGTIARFGPPEVIVGDKGAQGKQIVETINSRYGLGVIAAEKQMKYDFQEILNADFQAGRVRIPTKSDLDDELCSLQWELTKDKVILVRTGKLREDPKCANHLCDALLYIFRYAYHFFSKPNTPELEKFTKEWYERREQEAIDKLRNRSYSDASNDYFKTAFKEIKQYARDTQRLRELW